MRERLVFLAFLLIASVAVGAARAGDSWTFSVAGPYAFSLRAPGWMLSFDSQPARFHAFASGPHEQAPSRVFSIRLSSTPLAPAAEGWRLPLNDSTFLSLEATVASRPADPMLPWLARPSLQAVVGLGVEF